MGRTSGDAYRRRNPEAQQEKRRSYTTIKAFRMVGADYSANLAGIIRDLERDEAIPRLTTVYSRHPVYALDPHSVKKQIGNSIRGGYSAGLKHGIEVARRLIAQDHVAVNPQDDIIDAEIGAVTIRGISPARRRLLTAVVESEEMIDERCDMYETLGAQGIRGFQNANKRKVGEPIIVLGRFAEPVHHEEQRQELVNIVEDALVIQQATHIQLGPMQVV